MLKRIPLGLCRAGLLALLTVAFVTTAFAHRIPSNTDLAAEAYVLAGGDFSSICGGSGSGGKTPHRHCDACHIVGSMIPHDAPWSIFEANLILVTTVIAPKERRAMRSVLDLARGVRAPPQA